MTHHPYLGTAGTDQSTRDGYGHTADEPIPYYPTELAYWQHPDARVDPKLAAGWVVMIVASVVLVGISLRLIVALAIAIGRLFGIVA